MAARERGLLCRTPQLVVVHLSDVVQLMVVRYLRRSAWSLVRRCLRSSSRLSTPSTTWVLCGHSVNSRRSLSNWGHLSTLYVHVSLAGTALASYHHCLLTHWPVQYSTVQYSTVQYSTVQYSTPQCSTVVPHSTTEIEAGPQVTDHRVSDFGRVGSGHGSVCQTHYLTRFWVLTCAFIMACFYRVTPSQQTNIRGFGFSSVPITALLVYLFQLVPVIFTYLCADYPCDVTTFLDLTSFGLLTGSGRVPGQKSWPGSISAVQYSTVAHSHWWTCAVWLWVALSNKFVFFCQQT